MLRRMIPENLIDALDSAGLDIETYRSDGSDNPHDSIRISDRNDPDKYADAWMPDYCGTGMRPDEYAEMLFVEMGDKPAAGKPVVLACRPSEGLLAKFADAENRYRDIVAAAKAKAERERKVRYALDPASLRMDKAIDDAFASESALPITHAECGNYDHALLDGGLFRSLEHEIVSKLMKDAVRYADANATDLFRLLDEMKTSIIADRGKRRRMFLFGMHKHGIDGYGLVKAKMHEFRRKTPHDIEWYYRKLYAVEAVVVPAHARNGIEFPERIEFTMKEISAELEYELRRSLSDIEAEKEAMDA